MSKANENAARDSAKNLMSSAQTQTAPIINNAGQNADASRTAANNTLSSAGDTISKTALPTLNAAGSADQAMADTGGFSDADKTAYLNRATEASTQAGNAYSDQAKLAASKTGQGNPGAVLSRIARQAGQNASEATNNAEAGLNTQINQNKLAGAGQLANVGQAQTSAGNAQTNIGNTQASMSNQSAQQQLQALGLQFNSEEEAQQALDSLSHNPGVFDNLMSIGKLGVGAVGAYAGSKH